jgi:hypothetical protein
VGGVPFFHGLIMLRCLPSVFKGAFVTLLQWKEAIGEDENTNLGINLPHESS